MGYKVGDAATRSKTMTDEDIRAFAELTGDHNPVRLDDEYAARTRFGRRIAHGMLAPRSSPRPRRTSCPAAMR